MSKTFKETSPDFVITPCEEDEGFVFYVADFQNQNFTLEVLIDELLKKVLSDDFEPNAVILFNFKGVDLGVTKNTDKLALLTEFKCLHKNKTKSLEDTKKRVDKTKWLQMQKLLNEEILRINEGCRKDKLFGFKYEIGDGRPELIRLLDNMTRRLGPKQSEALLKVLKTRNLVGDELLYTFRNECAGNYDELIYKLKNNDSKLYDGKITSGYNSKKEEEKEMGL